MARKQPIANAKEFHSDHPNCWMCAFLMRSQRTKTELHHIAGRGRNHNVRENYAALCQECHPTLQSRMDAEVICLVLKHQYDFDHYDPALICALRGRAEMWITEGDLLRCKRIMDMMLGVARC